MNRSYHHGDLRRALIDEASLVLAEEGADAITLRGLARRLDVSHAAPGHHFADKTELLAELAADGFAALAAALENAMSGRGTGSLLAAGGRAYVEFAVANPELYRMMFGSRLLTEEECPERLLEESSRAYSLLLLASHGEVPTDYPENYRVGVPELAAWSLIHGAGMLFLDGHLGTLEVDRFLVLVDGILASRNA